MAPIELTPTNSQLPWEGKDQNSINLKSCLTKWNVLPDLTVKTFLASCQIEKKDEVGVIEMIFATPSLFSSLKRTDSISDEGNDLTDNEGLPITPKAEPLLCTVLNMNFFDNLIDAGMISESGYIRGCYEEEIDGILVQDRLRLMLANDNQGEHTLPRSDRKEFIFHLLKLLSIGGAKCQCENNFNILGDVTKLLYKYFIQVRKTSSGNVETCSSVYELTKVSRLYTYANNVHNKCYVIISGKKVTLMWKQYIPFW